MGCDGDRDTAFREVPGSSPGTATRKSPGLGDMPLTQQFQSKATSIVSVT